MHAVQVRDHVGEVSNTCISCEGHFYVVNVFLFFSVVFVTALEMTLLLRYWMSQITLMSYRILVHFLKSLLSSASLVWCFFFFPWFSFDILVLHLVQEYMKEVLKWLEWIVASCMMFIVFCFVYFNCLLKRTFVTEQQCQNWFI